MTANNICCECTHYHYSGVGNQYDWCILLNIPIEEDDNACDHYKRRIK